MVSFYYTAVKSHSAYNPCTVEWMEKCIWLSVHSGSTHIFLWLFTLMQVMFIQMT